MELTLENTFLIVHSTLLALLVGYLVLRYFFLGTPFQFRGHADAVSHTEPAQAGIAEADDEPRIVDITNERLQAASRPSCEPAHDERSLCCPVSLELFDDPVQTPCCGNSLNRASLQQALPRCPLCRIDVEKSFPTFSINDVPTNRVVASLVEDHRAKLLEDSSSGNGSGTDASASSSAAAEPALSKLCDQCNRPGARFRCSRCKCACYCSAGCQRAAWAQHKRTCLATAAVSGAAKAATSFVFRRRP